MNIKEAYKIATTIVGHTPEEIEEAKAILLKSLNRLETLEKENQELKDKIKELEFLNENLNKYIDNFRQNANIQNLYDNQQIYKLKLAIKSLKLVIEMPMENDIDYVDSKGNNLYKLRIKRLLGEEAYNLVKEVFESVGVKCE